uniref:UBA domain-containing protein n=2 Tax=Erpetoichthys calabaricus TaxID=27687 RepID=A0A8C4S1F4_ERPCA
MEEIPVLDDNFSKCLQPSFEGVSGFPSGKVDLDVARKHSLSLDSCEISCSEVAADSPSGPSALNPVGETALENLSSDTESHTNMLMQSDLSSDNEVMQIEVVGNSQITESTAFQHFEMETQDMCDQTAGSISVSMLRDIKGDPDSAVTELECPTMELDEVRPELLIPDTTSVELLRGDLIVQKGWLEKSDGNLTELPTRPAQVQSENCPLPEPSPPLAAALLELHELLIGSSKGASDSLTPNTESSFQNESGEDMNQIMASSSPSSSDMDNTVIALVDGDFAKADHCETPPFHSGGTDLIETESLNRNEFEQVHNMDMLNVQTDVQSNLDLEIQNKENFQGPPQPEDCSSVLSTEEGQEGAKNTTQADLETKCDIHTEVPLNLDMGCQDVCFPLQDDALSPSTSCIPERSTGSPLALPSIHIEMITSAGFTTQEAIEALHQFPGNPELALLILLARKIIVPS